jgi:hypothetical protein
MYGASSGPLLVVCATCQWTGRATFHFLPQGIARQIGAQQIGGQLVLGMFPPQPVPQPGPLPAATPEPAPDPLAARREALWAAFHELAGDLYTQLTTAPDDWWQMTLWQRYDHLQRAHAALYDALGGSRMGAYRPQNAQVQAALVELLLWTLLTLDGAQR